MELNAWEMFGLTGQALFGSRFLYQWLSSEKAGRSVVPVGFWWLSIAGSFIVFIYAIHKESLPFMISFITGAPVYIRNLVLVYRERKRAREAEKTPEIGAGV